jgi:hypothetical protein
MASDHHFGIFKLFFLKRIKRRYITEVMPNSDSPWIAEW